MAEEDYDCLTVRSGGKAPEQKNPLHEKPKIYKKNFCEAKSGCDRFLTTATLTLTHSNQRQTKPSAKKS
jgi:hypothetical protein